MYKSVKCTVGILRRLSLTQWIIPISLITSSSTWKVHQTHKQIRDFLVLLQHRNLVYPSFSAVQTKQPKYIFFLTSLDRPINICILQYSSVSLSVSQQKCDCLLSLEANSLEQKARVCQCLSKNIKKQLQLHTRQTFFQPQQVQYMLIFCLDILMNQQYGPETDVV